MQVFEWTYRLRSDDSGAIRGTCSCRRDEPSAFSCSHVSFPDYWAMCSAVAGKRRQGTVVVEFNGNRI